MATPLTKSIDVDSLGLDFESLRQDGIDMLQDLCGLIWTDYNLHDPGVTILEQLCYALTDLTYRTDFNVADYLTDSEGEIDFTRQALYRPQEIFSSQALTENDFRKILYDQVSQIANIWIKPFTPDSGQPGRGLFTIYVVLGELIDGLNVQIMTDEEQAKNVQHIKQMIKLVYSARRTLNEDIDDICIVQPKYCLLKGEIEIEGIRSPAEILAQILFDCTQHLSGGLNVKRFNNLFSEGLEPEHVFEGPITRHGHVVSNKSNSNTEEFTTSDFISLIRKIDGVKQIRSLSFVDERGNSLSNLQCNLASRECARLLFPQTTEQEKFLQLIPTQGLLFGGHDQHSYDTQIRRDKNHALYAETKLELTKLEFERKAFRTKNEDADTALQLPQGKYRDFRAFYSVQHQFPANYGINRYGVPQSAGVQRKAQARQLKGYLFSFEQMMGNYLENLQKLPELFSPEILEKKSYYSQYLGDSEIPDIEELYVDTPEKISNLIAEKLTTYDNYFDRKSRVLDYLLGLYGESFSQVALRRFNQCHRNDTEQWLLDAKATLLKELTDLSAQRAVGFNYLKSVTSKSNIARLQKRVNILLGIQSPGGEKTLSKVLAEEGISLVSDKDFEVAIGKVLKPKSDAALPLIDFPIDDIHPISLDFPIGETFFRNGVFSSNYRLVTDGQNIVVCYLNHDELYPIRRFKDYQDANQWAFGLIARLTNLNRQCEGMILVEHMLLRPAATVRFQNKKFGTGVDFYDNRISIILPSWSVRFSDPEFRVFAEDVMREHCPAHIYPYFHWLNLKEVHWFETKYQLWREQLRQFHFNHNEIDKNASQELDLTASQLVDFIFRRLPPLQEYDAGDNLI